MFSHPPGEATLTDSVRCSASSPNTFTCEVELDSEFETLTCEAAAPEPPTATPAPTPPFPATPAADPAVSRLVSSFVSKTLVAAPAPPSISGAALLTCASSELSIVLAALGGKGPLVTSLTMLKAVLDAGSCLTRAHDEAAQRNASDYCVGRGGIVVGVDGDKTTCEVRERVK